MARKLITPLIFPSALGGPFVETCETISSDAVSSAVAKTPETSRHPSISVSGDGNVVTSLHLIPRANELSQGCDHSVSSRLRTAFRAQITWPTIHAMWFVLPLGRFSHSSGDRS